LADAEAQTTHSVQFESEVTVRNLSKRELDVRLVPWGRVVETQNGLEMFERGAFADAVPADVYLQGQEHEVHMGLGQNGQPVLTRHPVGRATALDDREDAQYATFRVARTARGDEVLALADDGLVAGISVEFSEVPGGTEYRKQGGRRLAVHKRARLSGASTTYRPTYPEASVVAVRSEQEGSPVADAAPVTEATPAPPVIDIAPIMARFDQMAETQGQARAASDDAIAQMLDRLEKLEEHGRAQFTFPAKAEGKAYPDDFSRGDWLKLVLRTLSGEMVSQTELQARVAADLVTADNLGVVPPAYLSETIGIIDPSRPFLESTRKLPFEPDGMTLTVPTIATRPTTGVQTNEKDELTSTTSSIGTTSFSPTTIGGYGDISLQLLKRSSPSFLSMYLDLLNEAYAIDADDKAVDALLAIAAVNEGGAIDPDDGPQFGAAWQNAAAVSRQLIPDRLWLSTAATAAFIDAKSSTTNAPLYANLAANFTAGGGPGGLISGLRPVHVPALDDEAVDIIVGPSRGFAWMEDGVYTLQVDVPAKAGRDVGIVGMIFYAPMYPAAFTTYTLSS
jgi:phage head maturation protease